MGAGDDLVLQMDTTVAGRIIVDAGQGPGETPTPTPPTP